jgi:hypothetical protein
MFSLPFKTQTEINLGSNLRTSIFGAHCIAPHSPPAMAGLESACVSLLDVPGHTLQSVIQSMRPTELVAIERACTRLRHVVRAHPFAAWLRKNNYQMKRKAAWDDSDDTFESWLCSNSKLRGEAWLRGEDATTKAQSEWGHPRLCAELARDGRLDLLRWVRSHDPPCPLGWQTGWEACKRRDPEMLEWLAAQGYDPEAALAWDVDGDLSVDAMTQGDLPLLKWLDFWAGPPHPRNGLLLPGYYSWVGERGHLHVLRWLHERQEIWTMYSCVWEGAVEGGQLKVLEWLHELRSEVDSHMRCFAAKNGDVPVLQWLTDHGVDMVNPLHAEAAAQGGRLAVLGWMMNQGLELTTNAMLCKKAAAGGDLKLLQWLHSLGCPMDVAECTTQLQESIKQRPWGMMFPNEERTEDLKEVLNWLIAIGGEERSAA